MNSIINNIKIKTQLIPKENPIFIYIGVGTYAGLRNENGILELQNYHQYPPFLQELKNIIPNLQLFIILIDKLQENPPYCVGDKNLKYYNEENNIDNNIINLNIINNNSKEYETYINYDNSLTLYCWRQYIHTEPYNAYDDSIDITQQLRNLNNFCIREQVSLLYHDFSGRDNKLIADYFDNEIKGHLNHIIYGLSSRQDHGCYFNLHDIGAYMPYRGTNADGSLSNTLARTPPLNTDYVNDDKRYMIELFNIYYFIVNNKLSEIDEAAKLFPPYMHCMINNQKNQVIQQVKDLLKNKMLTILRACKRLINGTDPHDDYNAKVMIDYIWCPKERAKCELIYNEKKYNDLFDEFIDFFAKELDKIVAINKLDISGKEILLFITQNEKHYEWYDTIKEFL